MGTQHPTDPPHIAVPLTEAARMLGVSEKYLEKLRAGGGGPRFSRFGRAIRYPIAGLHEWMDAQQVEPRGR